MRNDDVRGVPAMLTAATANASSAREPIGAPTTLAARDRKLALLTGIFLGVFLFMLLSRRAPGFTGLGAQGAQSA